MMPERISTLKRMSSCNLNEENTKWFSVQRLLQACARIEAFNLMGQFTVKYTSRLQQELIEDPAFAKLYNELLKKEISNDKIIEWLKAADVFEEKLSTYPAQLLVDLKALNLPDVQAQYEYLKYYSQTVKNSEEQAVIVKNICAFYSQNAIRLKSLSKSQRNFLQQPYFGECICISATSIEASLQLLDKNEALQKISEYLYSYGVDFFLDEQNLRNLQWLQKEDEETVHRVFELLGKDHMGKFMERWLENNALPYDLNWFIKQDSPISEELKDKILDTRLGYLNYLYSGKLQVPFEEISGYQLDVLLYAIAHKKHGFLKLVSENYDEFSDLDYHSMLFDPQFYSRCNLNTLTLKSLKASRGDRNERSHLKLLDEQEYTFEELRTLRYVKPVYIKLYIRLIIPRVDDKLIVIREFIKKDLLQDNTTDDQLNLLAERFSIKPLSLWRQKELSHIKELSLADSIRVLLVYDKIKKFLPEIETWEEAVFAARNAEQIQAFTDWRQVKENMVNSDQDWQNLVQALDLSKEFITQHLSRIQNFVLKEGAEMTWLYYKFTDKKEAFRRIIQAELMGKFKVLKYFEDDLRREINYPIGIQQQKCWETNTSLESGSIKVTEEDDYYSTLRLGELPYATCLSYQTGSHKECLLAGFDSNKKMLLARKNGVIVGRAVVRLTKGAFQEPEKGNSEASLDFVDLLAKDEPEKKAQKKEEQLTLFLERLYFSQVNDTEKNKIKKMFVKLMREKAEQMGAVSVLALDYMDAYEPEQYVRVGYCLYISKSKSGAQYLDSLSGHASASMEGSYERRIFLVSQRDLEE